MSGDFSGERVVLCPPAVAFLPSRSSNARAPLSLQAWKADIVLQPCMHVRRDHVYSWDAHKGAASMHVRQCVGHSLPAHCFCAPAGTWAVECLSRLHTLTILTSPG